MDGPALQAVQTKDTERPEDDSNVPQLYLRTFFRDYQLITVNTSLLNIWVC